MSISVNIQAADGLIISQAVSVIPAHVTAMDRRDQTGLTWWKRKLLEEARGGAFDGVLLSQNHTLYRFVPFMRATCVLLARGRKCRRMLNLCGQRCQSQRGILSLPILEASSSLRSLEYIRGGHRAGH